MLIARKPNMGGLMNHRITTRSIERRCYEELFELVHPDGLRCPRCHEGDGVHVHEHHRPPRRMHYRCRHCAHVFNAWNGTPLQGVHRPPSEIWRIMQGILAKESDSQLARELGRDRGKLAKFRHKLQRWINSLSKEDFTKMATILKKRV
jgi:transposase-like protein